MKKAFFLYLFSIISLLAVAQSQSLPEDAMCPEWRSQVPEVVFPDTGLVNLYYKTWETAAGRIRRGPVGLPASPYLDENCYDDQIWIWDTCFMTLFSKYCPSVYPGKETMQNLYVPLHDHRPTPLNIIAKTKCTFFQNEMCIFRHFSQLFCSSSKWYLKGF